MSPFTRYTVKNQVSANLTLKPISDVRPKQTSLFATLPQEFKDNIVFHIVRSEKLSNLSQRCMVLGATTLPFLYADATFTEKDYSPARGPSVEEVWYGSLVPSTPCSCRDHDGTRTWSKILRFATSKICSLSSSLPTYFLDLLLRLNIVDFYMIYTELKLYVAHIDS